MIYTGNMDSERINGLTDHVERAKEKTLREQIADLKNENENIKREISALKTQNARSRLTE